jgi:phage terminase large subunit-like protein
MGKSPHTSLNCGNSSHMLACLNWTRRKRRVFLFYNTWKDFINIASAIKTVAKLAREKGTQRFHTKKEKGDIKEKQT